MVPYIIYLKVTCPWVFFVFWKPIPLPSCYIYLDFSLLYCYQCPSLRLIVSRFCLLWGKLYLYLNVTCTWDFFAVLYLIPLPWCYISLGLLCCAVTQSVTSCYLYLGFLYCLEPYTYTLLILVPCTLVLLDSFFCGYLYFYPNISFPWVVFAVWYPILFTLK